MLIPWIGGIDVNSVLGLDCEYYIILFIYIPLGCEMWIDGLMMVGLGDGIGTGMQDDTPNDQCKHQVMCCDGQPNVCLPFSFFLFYLGMELGWV